MVRVYVFILLCLGWTLGKGQQFSGILIIEDRSSFYLNQVYVTNITTQKTILSEPSGRYSIAVKVGDIVRFTSIVTERKDIKITEKHLQNTNNVITLQVAYIEIGDVFIEAFKPSKNLKKDVLSLKKSDKVAVIKKAVGLPEPKGDGLPPELTPVAFANGGLSLSIDAIYDILSGERKKKERLRKYEVMMISIREIKKYYGEPFFKTMGIPENMIDNFLQFVYSSEDIQYFIDNKNFEAVKIPMEKYLPVYKNRLKNTQLLNLKID